MTATSTISARPSTPSWPPSTSPTPTSTGSCRSSPKTPGYLPGHGPELHGLAAIRAEFAPQFAGRYGAMTFDVYDQVIDESRRRATIRWACRLDLTGANGRRAIPPLRWFARLRYGGRMQWHGLDVFHFNAAGQITGKFTYATFRLPLWEGAR